MTEEHNKNLHAVIQRLLESGLTLNKAKCQLNKTELDFWGVRLSEKGAAISPERVQALRQMKPPTNSAETK
jgi:hypothetical protein